MKTETICSFYENELYFTLKYENSKVFQYTLLLAQFQVLLQY